MAGLFARFRYLLARCPRKMDSAKSSLPQFPFTGTSPTSRLVELVNLRYVSKAICVAAEMGIANVVTPKNPVHITEIAKQLDCHETNLYRIMSLLAAYGIFEQKDGHSFVGNEISEAMREDAKDNCRNAIAAFGLKAHWDSLTNMELTLRNDSDKTPFEIINKETFYDYLAHHPEEQRIFDKGVSSSTVIWQSKVPSFYDFSRYASVVDLAGGRGGLLKAIMLKCPNVQATLFEQPSVIEHVLPELLTDEKFKTRFRPVIGNFLQEIDVTADLFTMAMTLHCFEDNRLAVILKNIATAMCKKPKCRLLILENDYEEGFKANVPSNGRFADMRMLLVAGGRERDFYTWQSLLKAQGIKILQKIKFPQQFMGLECELD